MPDNGARRFRLIASGAVIEAIRRLHRQARREGRGDAFTAALRQIKTRLEFQPLDAGEPAYPLAGLDLQMRSIARRPIVVQFGVNEAMSFVVIQSVQLLGK